MFYSTAHLPHTSLSKTRLISDQMFVSFQISVHLQDAHEWFKSKFDHLQDELFTSRLVDCFSLFISTSCL